MLPSGHFTWYRNPPDLVQVESMSARSSGNCPKQPMPISCGSHFLEEHIRICVRSPERSKQQMRPKNLAVGVYEVLSESLKVRNAISSAVRFTEEAFPQEPLPASSHHRLSGTGRDSKLSNRPTGGLRFDKQDEQ